MATFSGKKAMTTEINPMPWRLTAKFKDQDGMIPVDLIAPTEDPYELSMFAVIAVKGSFKTNREGKICTIEGPIFARITGKDRNRGLRVTTNAGYSFWVSDFTRLLTPVNPLTSLPEEVNHNLQPIPHPDEPVPVSEPSTAEPLSVPKRHHVDPVIVRKRVDSHHNPLPEEPVKDTNPAPEGETTAPKEIVSPRPTASPYGKPFGEGEGKYRFRELMAAAGISYPTLLKYRDQHPTAFKAGSNGLFTEETVQNLRELKQKGVHAPRRGPNANRRMVPSTHVEPEVEEPVEEMEMVADGDTDEEVTESVVPEAITVGGAVAEINGSLDEPSLTTADQQRAMVLYYKKVPVQMIASQLHTSIEQVRVALAHYNINV